MTNILVIELCCENHQSAKVADQAGVERIELCSALQLGGLTPSKGLIKACVNDLAPAVHVLIRPRAGNFIYSPEDVNVMLDDIKFCHDLGVDGVVVGAMKDDGTLDFNTLEAMKSIAGQMEVTCHRCFDMVINPHETLNTLIELGFNRILSSGKAPSAWEGRKLLADLTRLAEGDIEIMAGGGINADNVVGLVRETNARSIHFSGSSPVLSDAGSLPGLDSDFRASNINMVKAILHKLTEAQLRL